MIITKIKRIASTNRFNLYADDQWQGVFLDEILAVYGLKTNQEIDEHRFKEIKEENDKKVSFDLAVGYLEKYNVSEKGLADYLKKKGFSLNAVKETVEKVKEYGFVDDEKFAKNYFETLTGRMGKRSIATKLLQKGVSKEIVENLIENVEEQDELEKAVALAVKFAKNRDNSLKTKQKCLAHLIYKGYDYSVAQQATKLALSNLGGEDDWL